MKTELLVRIYSCLKNAQPDHPPVGIAEAPSLFFRRDEIRRLFRRLGVISESEAPEKAVEQINRTLAKTALKTGDAEETVRAVFREHASGKGPCKDVPLCRECAANDLCKHRTKRPTIKQLPKGERPRERLISGGEDQLSDAELLGIIIGGGRPQNTAVDLARRLLTRYDGFRALGARTIAELQAVPGIGDAKAAQIKAALAIARRFASEPLPKGEKLKGSRDLFEHFRERLQDTKRETFWAVLLDQKHKIIRADKVSEGSLSQSIVHPREVFSPAIRESAAAVAFVHNHPSGDPEPSPDDIDITRRLRQVGELVGIRVLDHVIIGGNKYVSLAERGIL